MKDAPTTTTANDDRIRQLEEKVRRLEEENHRLRGQLVLDGTGDSIKNVDQIMQPPTRAIEACSLQRPLRCEGKLSKEEVERYSRQLLLTTGGFGVQGQLKLLQARVLVVGAGGIGSTVLQYLGAAGVGTIGIVDFDVVEMSNLHRQIIHSSHTVGRNKAESARQAVLDLNPTITCHAIPKAVTVDNVMELVRDYDCIVDASDNPATRYLLNDACCLLDKPLVSGSAVGAEGQCTVYHSGGPCYRCMYPNPAVQSSCRACSDAGVLGPVPGLIGILQAMEVLKVLTGTGSTLHDRFVMYDATSASFMNIKKPPKHVSCAVCGPNPQIRSIQDSHETLRDARGPAVPTSSSSPLLPAANSFDVSCREYKASMEAGEPHVLLDVRVAPQFAMCALPHALNIPLAQLPAHVERVRELATAATTGDGDAGSSNNMPVYCICRRGYASVQAAELLRAHGIPSIRNVRGGLVAWQRDVDPSFPKY